MIPEPPTPDFAVAPVRVLVQDGKPLVPGAEQLIAAKQTNQPFPNLSQQRKGFIANFPSTTIAQRKRARKLMRPAEKHDDLARQALSIVEGGQIVLVKPEEVSVEAFQSRILTSLSHRKDTRSWKFSMKSLGCNRVALVCKGKSARNGAQGVGVSDTTSSTHPIAPEATYARESSIPAKLGKRLRDPKPDVIRRGLENRRQKATRKVAELEMRLEAERGKLAGIADSLGRLA